MKQKLNGKRLLKAVLFAILAGIIVVLTTFVITEHSKFSWMLGCCTAIYYFILFVFGNYEHKKWWNALIVSCCMGAIIMIAGYIFEKVDIITMLFLFVISSTFSFPIILCSFDTREISEKAVRPANLRKPKEWRKYETVNDIPDPTEREILAIKAAKWWSENLNIYSNKESTGDTFADGILMLARSNTTDLTESTIDKFEVNLVRAISESTEKDLTLRTDYAPCGILWDLAKKLKISHNYFPQKFIMTISFDKNKIYVRHAHCPELDEIE